jgi:hypothetical protein
MLDVEWSVEQRPSQPTHSAYFHYGENYEGMVVTVMFWRVNIARWDSRKQKSLQLLSREPHIPKM